jgi:SAM-dependent methyltransferase
VADRWADRTWRPFGRTDPYFAVCTEAEFRHENLDDAARGRFFESGRRHVDWVRALIADVAGADFAPRRMLDFGCGVGRLVIPFAEWSADVVGADIAPEMLAEARRNVDARALTNVQLVQSDDGLTTLGDGFDLVHSFIVFQHIPPRIGESLFDRLIGRIAPGGVAALHLTYAREAPLWRKVAHATRRTVPGVNALANLVSGRRLDEPFLPMFEYRMERVLAIIQAHGAIDLRTELTDHGGHLGAMFVFRVPA